MWQTSVAQAQQILPMARLFSVYPNGAQRGGTADVTVAGTDLDDASGLMFSDPGITAVPKMAEAKDGKPGKPLPGQFTVTVKGDVKPGVYECRVKGLFGLSNPRAFMVGTYLEVLEKENNNNLKEAQEVQLNTTVSGRSDRPTDQDYYKFSAKKGQRIILESSAYRLDSRMDTTLILLDSRGLELARNRDVNRRDALLDFTVPADGDYIVEIHDFTFGGTADHFYRLSIGVGPYIDFVFPPAGLAGSTGPFTVYGRNLPGGQPSKVTVDGKPLDQLSVQIQIPGGDAAKTLADVAIVEPSEIGIDAIQYRIDSPQGPSNPISIGVAEQPSVLEQEPANNDPANAPVVNVPCEYQGQFFPRGDQDWVRFNAKKGDSFWIEVTSQRMGLTTDPFMLVQKVKKDDKGVDQVSDVQNVDDTQNSNIGGNTFDTTTTDPGFKFTAQEDSEYRVLVKDLYSSSRGDPRYMYRLAIRPVQPDFRLVAVPRFSPATGDNNQQPTIWSTNLRKGGSELVDVLAFRRDGFAGDIVCSVEGLPAGVTSSPVVIPAAQTTSTIVITAAENAAAPPAEYRVVGKAKIDDKDVTQVARNATMIWPGVQNPQIPPRSRRSRNLTLAINEKEAIPFSIDLGGLSEIEISRGDTLKIPVKITRRGDFKGAVALSNMNLPNNNFNGKKFSVDPAKSDGTYEIALQPGVTAGTYTTYLFGLSDYQYSRNAEGAKLASDRKSEADKTLAEAQKTAKAATDAKAAADKALATAKTEEKTAADQAKAAAAAAEKEATKEELIKAKDEAQKKAEEAAAKLKTATEAAAAAEKANTDAAAKVKDAMTEQTAAAAMATDLTNKAKPAKVNIGVPSPTVTIRVTPSPVAMTIAPPGALKKESKLEIPVTVRRINNFADEVPLKVTLQNAKGVKTSDVTIPKGQNEAKVVLEASKDAAGSFKVQIQAQPKINGQNLQASEEVTVNVE